MSAAANSSPAPTLTRAFMGHHPGAVTIFDDHAETHVVDLLPRGITQAKCRTGALRTVVPGAASHDHLTGGRRVVAPVGVAIRIRAVDRARPLPDVAGHIVQSPRVR